MPGRLDAKTAIVTGAGSGLGRATAELFAGEGARVVCADIDGSAADAVAQGIANAGGQAVGVDTDVCSVEDTERMARTTLDAFGSIDVLYANAGIGGPGTAADTDLEFWRKVIDVNLTGVWLSTRAVLPAMRRQTSGSILLQGSVAGLVGHWGGAPYAAAKGGVIALARQMTADYAREGLRINVICPGTIPTPLVRRYYEERAQAAGSDAESDLDKTAQRYPIGRLATVEEVANLAVFLASDEASYITGTTSVVDGGLTAV
jgi:NAD(P)-dependent dehydrogenase (short-subunit alcohol dehydrogenase family)